jgi:Cu/Ag efflux protein CusF
MSLHNFERSLVPWALIFVAITVALVMTTKAIAVQEQKPLATSESVTAKATVEAIDKTNRIVTLKGPEGNLVMVKADPSVKRFDELKVGDVVTATYTESIAVKVRKPGEPDPDKNIETVTPRPGTKPGATVTREQTITVTVEDIDRTAPSVTVKGPEGKVMSFRVRDPQRLEGVKVGDKVDITYTQSMLLKADPASQ